MQRLQTRYRELISAPSATPEESLDLLLDRFNENPISDPSNSQAEIFYQDILAGLQKVSPLLPQHLQGKAVRLSACVRWNKNEKYEGEALFRKAWELDRRSGLQSQEIATLTTWQRAINSLADHLSHHDQEGLNAIATMMGDPTFPDEAFHRLQELANNTGYKMNLWNHLLEALQIGYAEEDPYRKRLVLQEARSMTRAAVNMGDVIGEAKARLILAFALNDSGFLGEAAAHAVAVLELGRAVDLGDDGLRALAFLSQTADADFVKELKPRLAASMWA
jgi:hypothetical protein